MKHSALRSRVRGVSLVEVMVSLVIGLVVVGAVLVSYMASGKSSAQQAAYAEMNENAQLGLGLLSRDLLLAGYAQPTGFEPVTPATVPPTFTGNLLRTYSGRPVFGCDEGFADENVVGDVACETGTPKSPAIEMVYEADFTNTVPTSSPGSVPSDCLGNGLTIDPTNTFYIAFNRYYLLTGTSGRSELHCASRQGSAGQPLVDNVEAMKFWYGEAGVAPLAGVVPTPVVALDHRRVLRYVTAGNLADASFANVIAVKVCLLIRSSEAVLDMDLYPDPLLPPKYLDCDSTEQTITDKFLRRAYFTTVTLRNKMAF
ncbi:PilW family protein [Rhodoferax sp.]|uniref:PilW family protein n=1 Tax=Rhodoferax sp. TaxID=50421 RepID=UPI0025E640A7|nr:PilW family protein [Rhodoferax sp.]